MKTLIVTLFTVLLLYSGCESPTQPTWVSEVRFLEDYTVRNRTDSTYSKTICIDSKQYRLEFGFGAITEFKGRNERILFVKYTADYQTTDKPVNVRLYQTHVFK